MASVDPITESMPQIHDVIIIGAGPCGLAVASRLREHTPSAIFTDVEHQRYHWIRRNNKRMAIKRKNGEKKPPTAQPQHRYDMVVLDGSGKEFMTNWNRNFSRFEIGHLRSPMFFHVDPSDRDALLAFTQENGYEKELVEIGGCVGRERSKHQRKMDRKFVGRPRDHGVEERDRQDYFVPSAEIFKEHCDNVVQRYGLAQDDLVRQETVKYVDFDYVDGIDEVEKLFTITTDQRTWYSRICVLAVGAGSPPVIPSTLQCDAGQEAACHAMHIRKFPDPIIKAKLVKGAPTCVLIVGGGLTAAHLALNALKRGVTRVHILTRSELKVKPFDVDLDWMGKFKNTNQAIFWSADTDEERLDQLLAARNGGSITPRIHTQLKKHLDTGHLSIHTHTTLHSRTYNPTTRSWTLETTPPLSPTPPPIDYIYFATGLPANASSLPYLQTLHAKHPLPVLGGLPCLTDSLAWATDVPLFVTGRLAGLRLGPAAGNLGGARAGAERVAWGVEEWFERIGRGGGRGDWEEGSREEAVVGHGNRYAFLEEEG